MRFSAGKTTENQQAAAHFIGIFFLSISARNRNKYTEGIKNKEESAKRKQKKTLETLENR